MVNFLQTIVILDFLMALSYNPSQFSTTVGALVVGGASCVDCLSIVTVRLDYFTTCVCSSSV